MVVDVLMMAFAEMDGDAGKDLAFDLDAGLFDEFRIGGVVFDQHGGDVIFVLELLQFGFHGFFVPHGLLGALYRFGDFAWQERLFRHALGAR